MLLRETNTESTISKSANNTDEVFVTVAPKWGELMKYEQLDIVFKLLKELRGVYFVRDYFSLSEVENTFCSLSQHHICKTRLLISGSIGSLREKAFLELIRRVRLCWVSDLETNVESGLQHNDFVPHVKLAPLITTCKRTRALLRWHLARTAMRCGMMRAILERREHTRKQITNMLENNCFTSSTNSNNMSNDIKYEELSVAKKKRETTGRTSANDMFFNRSEQEQEEEQEQEWEQEEIHQEEAAWQHSGSIHELRKSTKNNSANVEIMINDITGSAVRLKRYLPFESFSEALRETTIDISHVVNNVPSILIAWSHRNSECMLWLNEHIFNDKVLELFEKQKGLKTQVATLIGADPWVKLVESYIKLPPSKMSQQSTVIDGKLCLFPRVAKRAQIILVNIDYDLSIVTNVYNQMLEQLKGWRSQEVYLLSLWAGSKGGISEFASAFLVDALPHISVTSPAKRNHVTYVMQRPLMEQNNKNGVKEEFTINVKERIEQDENKIITHKQNITEFVSQIRERACNDDIHWHTLSKNERKSFSEAINSVIVKFHVPLYFNALIKREFALVNPYAETANKGILTNTSSTVKMSGKVCLNHLLNCKEALTRLRELENFEFNVEVYDTSQVCLITEFEPVTPFHLLKKLWHAITCSQCRAWIKVDDESYYRCLHCNQCDGVLCETCATQTKNLKHNSHHILLRVMANTTSERMSLIWGPTNVKPYETFYGKLITNANNLHCGIYCNRCNFLIRGIRWKCAMCYAFDLCDTCMQKMISTQQIPMLTTTKLNTTIAKKTAVSFTATVNTLSEEHNASTQTLRIQMKSNEFNKHNLSLGNHLITHPMMQIRYATNEFADDILQPITV